MLINKAIFQIKSRHPPAFLFPYGFVHEKSHPVRLTSPALMQLRAGSVFTTLAPLRRYATPPPAGGRRDWLWGLVPAVSTAWRCFFRTLKNAKSRFAPARWAEIHPAPPQCLHRLGAVIVAVSYQRRAGRESGRRNGVLRCRAVSPTRRAGGRQFPAPGFSGGI